MNIFITVPVPKNAKHANDRARGLAFGIGPRRQKVLARLVGDNPCSYKGKTVVCRVDEGTTEKKGQKRPQFTLVPTQRKTATHSGPEIVGGEIRFREI